MMDVQATYDLIEGLLPGEWVAISVEEERILATSETVEGVYEKVKGWDMAKPPLFMRVPEPNQTWLL